MSKHYPEMPHPCVQAEPGQVGGSFELNCKSGNVHSRVSSMCVKCPAMWGLCLEARTGEVRNELLQIIRSPGCWLVRDVGAVTEIERSSRPLVVD